MSELANKIAKQALNKTININILDNKPKGVYYRVAEYNNDYDWKTLEYGIQKSLDYYK
jgi:hypothetical protein